jgi:spore coat polysaccharide biosynthesis protein SpsF
MTAGILLSVREKATRLPGKVLKPLGDGNVTEFLIRRLRQAKRADRVVLATSTDPRDAVLIAIAEREGIAAFRGSADDKLLRYRDACRAFALDFAVVVDGDDPFVSVEHIDRLIDHVGRASADYAVFGNLPLGAAGFGLAASALETICAGRPESDTELWGRLFLDDPRFVCATLTESDPLYARPDIRMTLDYEADYRFFVAVVDALNARGLPPSFAAIMQHIAAHPDLVAINADAQQAYATHLRASEPATLGSGPRR